MKSFLMIFQRNVVIKGLWTLGTFKRLFSSMDTHMNLQIIPDPEIFLAYFTLEWLVVSVSVYVPFQGMRVQESSPAFVTHVGFLSIVSHSMFTEFVRSDERSPTRFAFVFSLLVVVVFQMWLQLAHPPERLATDLALAALFHPVVVYMFV